MSTTKTRPAALGSGKKFNAYFACLAAYNQGDLHGSWVNLELCESVEDIQECIDHIIANSPAPGAEEWAMHDHEGLSGSCLVGTEWPSFQHLIDYVKTAKELDDSDLKAYKYFCEHEWTEKEPPSEDDFKDKFYGIWDSEADYAENFYEDSTCEEDKGPLWSCIDWEQVWYSEFSQSYSSEYIPDEGYAIFSS
tara:strand:- start:868 stop:1446 length:579 start_codon:yes stop_codon:yes gene_type:complete